jgi:hypothetical protein
MKISELIEELQKISDQNASVLIRRIPQKDYVELAGVHHRDSIVSLQPKVKMTVAELMEKLKEIPSEYPVKVFILSDECSYGIPTGRKFNIVDSLCMGKQFELCISRVSED